MGSEMCIRDRLIMTCCDRADFKHLTSGVSVKLEGGRVLTTRKYE